MFIKKHTLNLFVLLASPLGIACFTPASLRKTVTLAHQTSLAPVGCRHRPTTFLPSAVEDTAQEQQEQISSSSLPTRLLISNVSITDNGKIVRISFNDGSTYNFHSLWLRDACRDERHVAAKAGERILTATTVVGANDRTVTLEDLEAISTALGQDGLELTIGWNDGSSGNIEQSVFDVNFLKRYAMVGVAQCVEVGGESIHGNDEVVAEEGWNFKDDIPTWLEPYTGMPDARAVYDDERTLWSNTIRDNDGQVGEFVRYQHDDLMAENDDSPALLLDMIKTVLSEGVVLVDGVPDALEGIPNEDDAAGKLRTFITHTLGGLQKDPTRAEPNWKIVHKPNSSSISYDPIKRLNQHTDSSIPPHGIPALLLSMHYVKGYGANTLTDGFEVARVLQAEDPEGYELLTKYGYDGERDFAASRIDSTQSIAKGLVINRRHPIFVHDENGKLTMLQYNEVFRMPSTLPFDLFPQWHRAFSRFCELIHSEEYQRTVPMEAGTILLMNNWRVLHGRAGGRASPDRHLVGGTILRESVYSRAMQLARYLKKEKEQEKFGKEE